MESQTEIMDPATNADIALAPADYAERGITTGGNPGPLFVKLSKVLGEVHRVPKNGHNKFNNYKYATESDAADEIRPLLSSEGVGLVTSIDRVAEGANGRIFVYGTVTVGDEDGWISAGIIGEARDVDRNGARQDKGIYKAITGAVKYWLFKSFLMSTGDDPEADQNNPQNDTEPDSGPTAAQQTIIGKVGIIRLHEDELNATDKKGLAGVSMAITQDDWATVDRASEWIETKVHALTEKVG